MSFICFILLCERAHRYLHLLTIPFPSRRSSDLLTNGYFSPPECPRIQAGSSNRRTSRSRRKHGSMDEMIVTRELTKSFGSIKAVDRVSLTVARGEVLGFLGPNGAGKSTTMKMIIGFLRPTAGEARICGHDVQERPIEAKRRLGYLPEGAPLYGDMTARAFLAFVARTRGLSGSEKRNRIGLAVERTHLAAILDQPIDRKRGV